MATWAATAIATATVGATRYFNRYRFFSQKGRRKIISTNNVTFSKLFFVQDGFFGYFLVIFLLFTYGSSDSGDCPTL